MDDFFDNELKKSGLVFEIFRGGKSVGKTHGIFDKNNIQLISTPDIYEGDLLYQERMKKYHRVINATPISGFDGEIVGWIAQYEVSSAPSSQTINIHSIHGPAVVGSQQHFTVNYATSIDELRSMIAEKPNEDRVALESLANTLESSKEIKKGALAKFGGVLAKYADIAVFVGKLLLNFGLGSD